MNGGADENTVFTCNHSVAIGDDVTLLTGQEQNKEILSKIDNRVQLVVVKDLINEINPIKDLLALFQIKKIIKIIVSNKFITGYFVVVKNKKKIIF